MSLSLLYAFVGMGRCLDLGCASGFDGELGKWTRIYGALSPDTFSYIFLVSFVHDRMYYQLH